MDMWMDVDTALAEVPVNLLPLIDDTDFKTRETAVAYNAAGMDLVWNFVTTGGALTQTAVTPTTAGTYDWTHQGDGIYTIEIPASGGASINNDTEGFGWFSGVATGVLPWRGPVIGFRAAALNDALIDSAWSTTRGLAGTALPNAAAEASGGLPTLSAAQASNGTINANVHRWLTGTPNALQSGRVDSYLGAVATGVIAAGSFAANALDAVWSTATRVLTAATNLTTALATPTNITAGTITTVTTLTNAPSDSSGTTTLLSRLTSTRAGYLDNLSAGAVALASTFSGITSLAQWLGLIAGKQTGNTTARTELRATGAGSGTYSETTDSLEAVRDNMGTAQTGDAYARLGAPAGASVSADVAAVNAKTTNLPAAPASTTNITAGTITTVTNLTNAPTAGDLTATMKTSIGTAVAASAVASVTGNVGGNVTGSVGSVVGNVGGNVTGSVGSVAAGGITASSIAADAIGASELAADAVAEIADAVWDEVLSGHLTSGTTGAGLNAAGSAGDPWSTTVPGAYGAGTAGKILGDNLNATVSSRATQTSVDTVDDFLDTEIAAIKAKTDNLPASPASTTNITAGTITTVTNLTNAPTAGDFTTTMKTSIGTAVAASAVASVTGNVGGNVTGSVGSVATGGITAASIAADAIGASELATDAVAEIAAAVAAQVTTDHGSGSYARNTEPLDAAATRTAVGMASANLDTQLSALSASLSTIAGYIDTEVAAIKAKTDNLPSDPADASDIAASFASVASTLSTIAAYIDTEVAAIKVQTDKLTFTSGNDLDVNVQKVNDVALLGDGSATPWGPA